jgi:hypothetical protein
MASGEGAGIASISDVTRHKTIAELIEDGQDYPTQETE